MDIDFDLDDIEIAEDTRGTLKKFIKNKYVTHNNGPLNRCVSRSTPTLSEKGILLATNHRRTGKNILALDMDEAARFPNFDNVFKKEIDDLIKVLKKGGW